MRAKIQVIHQAFVKLYIGACHRPLSSQLVTESRYYSRIPNHHSPMWFLSPGGPFDDRREDFRDTGEIQDILNVSLRALSASLLGGDLNVRSHPIDENKC